MAKLLKILLVILAFFVGFYFSSKTNKVLACDCGSEYSCQGGTMCCTGDGCPTWCCDTCCMYGDCWKYGIDCCDCGTCGGCPSPPPPPPCSTSSPGGVSLSSPASGTVFYGATSVNLSWTNPSWGENCGSGSHHFNLYVNGTQVASPTTNSYTYNISQCSIYYTWYVVADNGAETGSASATWNFTNLNRQPTGNISGTVSGNMNSAFNYTTTVSDPDSNVTRLTLHRRHEDSPGVWGAWNNLSATYQASFSARGSYTYSSSWTPTLCSEVGRWQVVVNAYDDSCISGASCIGSGYDCKCTGNPDCSPPNCGTWGICNPSGVWAAPPAAMYTTVNPVYTFTAHVWDLGTAAPSAACPVAPPSGSQRPGANVIVTYEDGTFIASGTTDANGNFSIPNLQADGRRLRVSITCAGGCNTYTCNLGYGLACSGTSVVGGNTVLVDPAVPACGSNYAYNFGVREIPGQRWYTMVDGDVFADQVTDNLCETPSGGGFTGHIINRETRTGYAHSNGTISTGSATNNFITASGGFDKNNRVGAVNSFDKWLANYTFSIPSSANSYPGLNSFAAGGVYRTTVANFNSVIGNTNHTYTLNSDGVALLYVERAGGGSLTFNGTLTSTNANRRLIIITDAPVVVARNVGFAAGMLKTSSPNIDTPLMTTSTVTIDSLNSTDTADIPIMMQGPIVSKGVFSLNRNLLVANRIYPAGVYKYFPRFLYYLTQVERANLGTNGYTGLFQFDTPPWNYQE